MEITLEKIELVKDRTGVTYAEAKQALEDADGSVVDAIIAIEETINTGKKGRGFGEKGEALFDSLKSLVKKGNVSKIKVKRGDDTILNVPVNAGIVGICIAPLASVVAIVAAFGFKCVIEVIKDDGTIIDVSDAVTEKARFAAEYSSDKFEEIKAKGTEYYEKAKDSDIYDKAKDTAQDLKDKAENLKDKFKSEEAEAEEAEEVVEAAEEAPAEEPAAEEEAKEE
ncbi:MAG: DUF4342 domain-containing protein [Firmicutes bacterium]|nr:DUF4342 domain-containing protein [Bacillota bacterium]